MIATLCVAALVLIIAGAILAATIWGRPTEQPRHQHAHRPQPRRRDIWPAPLDHRAPRRPFTLAEAYVARDLHRRCHASWCPRRLAALEVIAASVPQLARAA